MMQNIVLLCVKLFHVFFFTLFSAVSAADRCLEPMSEGSCSEYALLWYFHPRSGKCRPFLFGGCGGNRNRFSSRQECQSWCGKERSVRGILSDHRGDIH
uniref:Si:dkey-117n7.5 n=1 Tax=Labrus bergylta TaxID=56723 RepID=A0A3Q3FVJ0_9LABR